jgi:methylenetetrahydrofolate reductase (NADPH)
MVDELSALGCDTPILPGIMPLTNPEGVRRMAKMSGATVPEDLAVRVEGAGSVEEAQAIAIEAALELSQELLEGGAPGLHLYGLNKSEIVLRLVDQLNLR